MESVKEIEKAVKSLPPKALRDFRRWFAKFDAENWDEQLEGDVKSGRLDKLPAQAVEL